MTRFLSEALSQDEPNFSYSLKHLESSHHNPSNDIKLTLEIARNTKDKIVELGLDPNDTTPEELFEALKAKTRLSDQLLLKKLMFIAASKVSLEADPVEGMIELLKDLRETKSCYLVKRTVLRTIIKASPPKSTMRLLGYRSVDSLLKREKLEIIQAVSSFVEPASRQKKVLEAYKKLQPKDFEVRDITLIKISGKRLDKAVDTLLDKSKLSSFSLKDVGSVVFLPMPGNVPEGYSLASLCLAIKAINNIKITSSYLKVNQFNGHFGQKYLKCLNQFRL